MDLLTPFILSIIPIMVAIDALGVLPLYIGMTEGMEQAEMKKVARQSMFTALLITIIFVFLGNAVFNILGIQVEDFMIAGGVLLLVISVVNIVRVSDGTDNIKASSTLGAVPLGTPLLAGPATLTTTLVLVNSYGYFPVLFSLVVNLLLAWFIFDKAGVIIRLMGINGARAFAKVASLVLAAIAVKMIRTGIFKVIGEL